MPTIEVWRTTKTWNWCPSRTAGNGRRAGCGPPRMTAYRRPTWCCARSPGWAPWTPRLSLPGQPGTGGSMAATDSALRSEAGTRPGDLLAVACTGAYSHSMASNYNLVGRPPVVAVRTAPHACSCAGRRRATCASATSVCDHMPFSSGPHPAGAARYTRGPGPLGLQNSVSIAETDVLRRVRPAKRSCNVTGTMRHVVLIACRSGA